MNGWQSKGAVELPSLARKSIVMLLLFTGVFFYQSRAYADTQVVAKPSVSEKAQPKAAGVSKAVANQQNISTSTDDDYDDSFLDDEDFPTFADPNENFNRVMFKFNDVLDDAILKPLATLYDSILPTPISQGVSNFFNNIRTLPTIANDVLQLHFYQAWSDLWRLTINTTIGIGGVFDMATRMGLSPYQNDFGLTMARYGYDNPSYFVWPFFGPSSIRDGVGLFVDYYAFSIYPRIHPPERRYAIYGLGVIDRRAQLLDFQNVVEQAALDKYVFIRNAYLQRRSFEIEQNQRQGFLTKTQESN